MIKSSAYVFAFLICILEWRTFRTAARPVRWTAVLLLALAISLWYLFPIQEHAAFPFRQFIRLLEPLVPRQL